MFLRVVFTPSTSTIPDKKKRKIQVKYFFENYIYYSRIEIDGSHSADEYCCV